MIRHHESLNCLYCPVSGRFWFFFISVWFATKSLSIACIAQFLLDFRFFFISVLFATIIIRHHESLNRLFCPVSGRFWFFYFCLIRHHESLNRLYCPVSVRFSFFFN